MEYGFYLLVKPPILNRNLIQIHICYRDWYGSGNLAGNTNKKGKYQRLAVRNLYPLEYNFQSHQLSNQENEHVFADTSARRPVADLHSVTILIPSRLIKLKDTV